MEKEALRHLDKPNKNGEQRPDISSPPIAPAAMRLNSTTDRMYTAISEKQGSGSTADASRCRTERYWRLVRDQLNGLFECHPGDFDSRAEGGATGWSDVEVLPYLRESGGLAPNNEISVDGPARNTTGPLVRDPILPAARQFVKAVVAAGIPRGDYNGRDGDPAGLVSLSQTTTGHGKRSSTYWAFLAGEPEQRSNLTLITGRYEARDPGRPARARERILGQSGAVSGSFASRTPRRTRRSPARCFRSRAPSYA